MGKIVLSYRREDSRTMTSWLHEKLVERYGKDNVFRDIDSIQPTENFRKRIGRALKDCDFVVAVIGPGWCGPTADGQSRINNNNDWVRVEIETALQLDIPLLPVLVEDAEMPNPEELPPSLHEITEINALPIASGGSRFYEDLDRLFTTIDRVLGSGPPAASREDVPGPETGATVASDTVTPPLPAADQPPPPSSIEKGAAAPEPPSAQPAQRARAPEKPVARAPGVGRQALALVQGRSLLTFIVVPGIVMVLLWTSGLSLGGPGAFLISALFMIGVGVAMRKSDRMRWFEAVIVGAIVGAAVVVALLFFDDLRQDELGIAIPVLVGGGAVATVAGFLLGGAWRSTPPATQ